LRALSGSTQITIIWDDGAIVNEWLQVTMLADQVTDLAADDVFYFGNAIGETGDSSSDALVTANDAARVAANETSKALVTNPYDINRDGVVDASDVALVNSHLTTPADALKLISFVPPTVATPASAALNPVTGTTAVLSVLGADITGESSLTYTWATTGTPPAAVTFSENDSNTAKNTVATFTRAGSYSIIATITDAGGSTVTSSVNVTVDQSLTSLIVTPGSAVVAGGTSQQFSVGGLDQFAQPMAVSPVWSIVAGEGSINGSGLYSPPYADGSATVQAASGGVTGTASVTYSGQAQWNSSTGGSWSTSGDWTDTASGTTIAPPGLRGIVGDTVLFGSATGTTASLDGTDPSLAAITFDNSGASYTISQGSGGVLHLADGGNSASITVSSGSHTISAPVELDSSLAVLPAAGSRLTISGGITGAGALTVDDAGTVVLSGTNGYTGGTLVNVGSLIIANASALPDGTSLAVGAGRSFVFGPGQSATSASAAGLIASVPGIAAASKRSTPIVAAYGPATPATSGSPSETPAAKSNVASDAVFTLHRLAFNATVGPADNTQSAGSWEWLAAIESSWNKKPTDLTVAALDKVLARFGV
jgi:autotransporter-associated beta strand protein